MPNVAPKFRHEIKLLLSQAEYRVMSQRLSALLPHDEFTTESGDYFIRSLYFDDAMRTAYFEKLSGVADRKKYRLRIYNYSDSVIKLECKEKRGDRIRKRSATVGRAESDLMVKGDFSGLYASENPLCREVLSLATGKGLKPDVVVDYDREAYTYPVGNVRLTFDKALHAGMTDGDVFNKELLTVPIFPDGSVIFEVKYDELMPSFIRDVVSTAHGQRIALSKFCLCRDALSRFKANY